MTSNIGVVALGLVILVALAWLIKKLLFRPELRVESYDSGEIRRKYYLKRGKKVGLEEIFYRSGRLNKKKNYVDGHLNGACTTYYESGNQYITATYCDNELKGEYTVFEEDGSVKYAH